MKFRSITLKILPLILVSFLMVMLGVLFMSKAQLTKIIDKSQYEIYTEKVDVIWETLNRSEVRLQKTGLVEINLRQIVTVDEPVTEKNPKKKPELESSTAARIAEKPQPVASDSKGKVIPGGRTPRPAEAAADGVKAESAPEEAVE